MLMCIQNLVKFCPLVVKILSGNENYDGITEGQKDRQGKSSIAPTFSKRGYNNGFYGVHNQFIIGGPRGRVGKVAVFQRS